jgi:hypothetical protein
VIQWFRSLWNWGTWGWISKQLRFVKSGLKVTKRDLWLILVFLRVYRVRDWRETKVSKMTTFETRFFVFDTDGSQQKLIIFELEELFWPYMIMTALRKISSPWTGKAHICRIPPAVPVVWFGCMRWVGIFLLDLCNNYLSPQLLVEEKVERK